MLIPRGGCEPAPSAMPPARRSAPVASTPRRALLAKVQMAMRPSAPAVRGTLLAEQHDRLTASDGNEAPVGRIARQRPAIAVESNCRRFACPSPISPAPEPARHARAVAKARWLRSQSDNRAQSKRRTGLPGERSDRGNALLHPHRLSVRRPVAVEALAGGRRGSPKAPPGVHAEIGRNAQSRCG